MLPLVSLPELFKPDCLLTRATRRIYTRLLVLRCSEDRTQLLGQHHHRGGSTGYNTKSVHGNTGGETPLTSAHTCWAIQPFDTTVQAYTQTYTHTNMWSAIHVYKHASITPWTGKRECSRTLNSSACLRGSRKTLQSGSHQFSEISRQTNKINNYKSDSVVLFYSHIPTFKCFVIINIY